MARRAFPASRVPRFNFGHSLEDQERELARNPLVARMAAARREKAGDPHRPRYHFVSPEYRLNDPNGLCFWHGRWHLFYQAYPPEDPRQHWGHAVSDDLIHWRDLPYALYPGPEDKCYSGTTLVEEDRVIAIYHGTEIGNMVAVSRDPLLLNWEKLTGHAVIPFGPEDGSALPHSVFDPCIWAEDGAYYALSAGVMPSGRRGKHTAADYLFRSTDLEHWEYLHPFVEGDRFTLLGDDGACPYFWPIGDRHILLFFSHMSGGQYLLGDYDRAGARFVVDAHGRFNFGATFPGGVHAPTAAPDGNGGVIAMFNMNPAKPTYRNDDYLAGFFDESMQPPATRADPSRYSRDWDQILTLPRRLSLRGSDDLRIEPAGDIESLRFDHRSIGQTTLAPNRELVLEEFGGSAIELGLEVDPKHASVFEVRVLRSPDRQEFTRICFFDKRGYKYREPFPHDARSNRVMSTALSFPVCHESVISIDTSCASTAPDVVARPPESAPVLVEPGEPVRLRIFVDRSVVEVFVNDRQCVAVRVYPERDDSTGISLLSRGQSSEVLSLDCWQMKSIHE